jgi:hypothetical protein
MVGIDNGRCRSGLEAVKSQLREEIVDGRSYWLPASSPPLEEVAPTALLLSIYDEYISGYKDRSAIIDEEIGAKLMAMGNALYYVVVVDGRIVGTWNRTLKKEAVIIEMRLFTRLTETENLALAAAAHRYGQFLGLSVVLA